MDFTTETAQSMPYESGNWFYTTTSYDALGRPLTVTAPDGTSTSYAYNGLTTTVTDAKNHSTVSVSNILGWTLSVTPPTGPGVVYDYDEVGNLLTATRGGATVTLTYDKAGRKLSMDDPDMGDWNYAYNALGSMTSQTDARGCVTNIAYDVLNRPTGKTYSNCPATSAVSYGYDAGTNGKGRRTSMADASGSTSWLYDPRGRVTKETKVISGTSFVTEWTLYNSADLPVTMKYPDGEIVTTQYNNNMQPTNVAGTENYVPSITYDSAGRLLTRVLGNGLTQTFNYHAWNQQGGRLETLTTGSLQNLAYVYDPVGNITQITNSIAGETSVYEYDALDRLTSWQLNQDSPEIYDYDSAGRLDQKGSLDLEYNDAAHVHAVTDANSNSYDYDQNGNQVTRTIASDTFTLIYDAENRLVEVKKNDETIAQFTFDGDGKRVMSVMDGETIRFVGGYYERKGSQITKYYMAGAARVAMRKYTIPQNMEVEYMLGDHLGSTSLTTDANGVKISELRYKPWGETRYTWTDAPANTSPTYELTKYQYTGQYSYDTEFGLKFYGARFYDSAVGRFVSADSIIPTGTQGTQAWDRYAFVNNNPVRYTDPSGHFICVFSCLIMPFFALGPDLRGVNYVSGNVNTVNAVVAAGMAVQSNFYGPWDNSSSIADSVGPAQLMSEEVATLDGDPLDPNDAALGMGNRIANVVNACPGKCSDTDRLILAALGQNYPGFSAANIKDIPRNADNSFNWGSYIAAPFNTNDPVAQFRQGVTGLNYSKELMLKLFMLDLQWFLDHGYLLPDDYDDADLDYIETLYDDEEEGE